MRTATAIVTAGLAILGGLAQLPAATGDEAAREVRIFVLDKNGTPVDVRTWTGAIDVTPANGTSKSYKLELVPAGKEHAQAESESEERYSDGHKADGQTPEGRHHDEMVCGQAEKMDDNWVEMIVVQPGKTGGIAHHHGSTYFRTQLDGAGLRDTKTGTINFTARLVFTVPNGDTKYVKGFDYPVGMIDSSLGRVIDKDFKDTSKWDHEQATKASHKVQRAINALPALSFAGDKDRQEYEKARTDCFARCKQLEEATGKDIADAADQCRSALKEVRSQAKDTNGASFE